MPAWPRSTWRPDAPTRSVSTWPRSAIPCVGDATYGADPVMTARTGLVRQWLHARRLGIAHPITGEHMVFTSDYPADLVHALDVMRLPGHHHDGRE